MKRIILISIALFAISWSLLGQDRSEMRKKVQNLRIAFYTEELELTSEESAAFWPIFNDYQRKKRTLHQQLRPSLDFADEKEANQLLDQHLEIKTQELDLYRSFIADLRTELPASKIIKIKKAELDFKRYLLELRKEKQK